MRSNMQKFNRLRSKRYRVECFLPKFQKKENHWFDKLGSNAYFHAYVWSRREVRLVGQQELYGRVKSIGVRLLITSIKRGENTVLVTALR